MARIVGAHISPFGVSRKEVVVCGERRLAPWKLWWHPPFEGNKVAGFSDEEDQSQLVGFSVLGFDSDGDRVHDLHSGKGCQSGKSCHSGKSCSSKSIASERHGLSKTSHPSPIAALVAEAEHKALSKALAEQSYMNEMDRLKKAYARRTVEGKNGLYDPLAPVTWMVEQEFERAFLKLIKKCRLEPVANLRVLDVGCGGGTPLLQLIRYGFDPANMTGIELLHDRYEAAARRLPKSVELVEGDAMEVDVGCGIFDVVIAFTVFSSILGDDFRKRLAKRLWSFCKPQGGVLWYDFTFNNPANPDVRAVPMREIRELFPDAKIRHWRVTLAPPVARVLTRLHPALYTLANVIVPLRTHVLCWIGKNGSP